jgi:sulfatase maturation enzyme AslB (radical SAM superfamily)
MGKKTILIPKEYDYVGVFLTDSCFLNCSYCITKHHGASYVGSGAFKNLDAQQWVDCLSRLVLPEDTPLTLQGGEPFLYKDIWYILENMNCKIDIMTALPPYLTKNHFSRLKTLQWNNRPAPYPTIRVSYHHGQNNFKELVPRIAELQEILSIGLYYLDFPATPLETIEQLKEFSNHYGIELRKKEFLGEWNGTQYGNFLYKNAACGVRRDIAVKCKNSVVPIAPDGSIYRCHSDLYFKRKEGILGNILDETFSFPNNHLDCTNYGLCSECDIKVKTNRFQQYGYTSVSIFFEQENDLYAEKTM